jgi:acetoin utilization deacetylase AcuC-like enzyme
VRESGRNVQTAAADDAQRYAGLRKSAEVGRRPLHARQTLKFVTDVRYGEHLRGVGHPESSERVEVVAERLRARGVIKEAVPARDASDDELLRVHTRAYLDLVERETEGLSQPRELSTGDVVVDAGSRAAALRAAGGAIAAIEACSDGTPVFALIRPPGHHAEPDRGMGFCLFNNVAVAARAYQAVAGGRVLIVDFDYHHGNGTQAVAGNGLSYVSTHADPAYPGTGRRSYAIGKDLVVNAPLPAEGVSTEAFVATWEALLPRVAAAVRPDLVLVSAGFDYVAGDPIGDLGIAPCAAAPLAAAISGIASRYAGGRMAYVLEGGYLLDALTDSIAQIAKASDRQVAVSGADPASIPRSIAALLTAISEIPQGGEAGAAN